MAQPRRPQPGAAVRRDRDGDVRLRPRPPDRRRRESRRVAAADVAPGLVWLATLFSLLLLVQRTFAVETEDGALDALRVAGVDAGGRVLGQDAGPRRPAGRARGPAPGHRDRALRRRACAGRASCSLVTTWLAATVGLAAVGTLYGGLAAGAGRETLLPLLLLPVVAPVLIGATRAVEAALGTGGTAIADGWPWVGVVAVFAVAFGAGGTLAFGPLIEE